MYAVVPSTIDPFVSVSHSPKRRHRFCSDDGCVGGRGRGVYVAQSCKELARDKDVIRAIEDSRSFLNATFRSQLRSYI